MWLAPSQGLEIGKKHNIKIFSIILDPALNQEVHQIHIFFSESTEPAKELSSEIPEINRKINKINSEQVILWSLASLKEKRDQIR